jgi:hypothetical protein
MVMKRFLLVVVALAGAGACDKPSAEDCRKAILHVEQLYGTENTGKNGDIEANVRLCKGGSSKQAVACKLKAESIEQLKACDSTETKSQK